MDGVEGKALIHQEQGSEMVEEGGGGHEVTHSQVLALVAATIVLFVVPTCLWH